MSRKIKKKSKPHAKKLRINVSEKFKEALSYHQQGRLSEAEKIYNQILLVDPKNSETLNLLGLVAQQLGDYTKAVNYSKAALRLDKVPAYYSNLGSALRGQQQLPEAIEAFLRALELNPDLFEAQYNLASTLLDMGKFKESKTCFRKAILMRPRMTELHEGLAKALYSQGSFDEVLECSDNILKIEPSNTNAYIYKGLVLQLERKFDKALSVLRDGLKIDDCNADILNIIGNILGKQGHYHESLSYYKKASHQKPDFIASNTNLAWTYLQHGMLKEALDCYKKLIIERPNSPEVYSDFIFNLNYDPSLKQEDHLSAANEWEQKFGKVSSDKTFFKKALKQNKQTQSRSGGNHKNLKIGFISPDFRNHPVGTFLLPLLSELAKTEIETYFYSELDPLNEDLTTSALKNIAKHWYQTSGKDNNSVAQRIYDDGLDILIDLAGHSANNRLSVLAMKPAPVQVSWLGYVNTTGLSAIDYRITDAETDPPGSESHYTESLIRLPHGFFCYEPPQDSPDISVLPYQKKGLITFGSLNNIVKISEEVVKVWSEIIRRTPCSQLIIVGRPFQDEFIKTRFKNMFIQNGVEQARLELTATLPMKKYLELYNRIDISLDPFPHNGHTITCHTLWMGVPVVTLKGDRYAARMGASIMTLIDLPELIAKTKEEYVTKAISLATDLDHLAKLRQSMRTRLLSSPMCDSKQFAHDFVRVMQEIINKPKINA